MIRAFDLGYQEQNAAFRCSDVGGRILCSGITAAGRAEIVALQTALGDLGRLGMRAGGEMPGAYALQIPTVDGVVGPETTHALRLAWEAARAKWSVEPSIPAASDGSHGGLTRGEMRVILERGTSSEVATWAAELAGFVRTVIALEQRSRGSVSSLLPQTGSQDRNGGYLALAAVGLGLMIVGGYYAASAKMR